MKKIISFEQGMEELETLVKTLESGQVSLEDSFKAYERAVELRDGLKKILEESDRRIRELTEDGEREISEEVEA
mgnify:CR=1 FL=1